MNTNIAGQTFQNSNTNRTYIAEGQTFQNTYSTRHCDENASTEQDAGQTKCGVVARHCVTCNRSIYRPPKTRAYLLYARANMARTLVCTHHTRCEVREREREKVRDTIVR